MAIYVLIRKVADHGDLVSYAFGPDETRLGLMAISRKSGDVTIVKDVPGDSEGKYWPRAKRKIWQHWKEGELPESTCWAA